MNEIRNTLYRGPKDRCFNNALITLEAKVFYRAKDLNLERKIYDALTNIKWPVVKRLISMEEK